MWVREQSFVMMLLSQLQVLTMRELCDTQRQLSHVKSTGKTL